MDSELFWRTAELAVGYLNGVGDRPVAIPVDATVLRTGLDLPLDDDGVDASTVIAELAAAADPGLVATQGPRYFGFVVGGALPVAVAADWLTSAWDQNAGLYAVSPAAAVVEQVAASWLLDLLGLPQAAGVGFVTGATMANVTCLAAARHTQLRQAGWDVEQDGLAGAPRVQIVVGAEAHASVYAALRLLGFGQAAVHRVDVDGQGRMLPGPLTRTLAAAGPAIVCAQVGNVNSGACDPVGQLAAITRERGAWLHVDGAFGLWAAASPQRRHLVAGVDLADSWATDGHKWLNVPYDSGIAVVADRDAHRMALATTYDPGGGSQAAYLQAGRTGERDGDDWTPEASRRARAVPVYAVLRHLGRRGIADLVERCCRLARLLVDRLTDDGRVEVLNEVVLNQVCLRFHPARGGDPDAFTRSMIERIQQGGVCWAGATVWHGVTAMRVSVSHWATREADIDRTADAIRTALHGAAG